MNNFNNPTFIWERYGQKLTMNPDKRYLIYYRGCFCPPHIGHFNTAASYIQHKNVRVIIHQMGGNRHGVPKNVNRHIWKLYIKKLFPEGFAKLIQYDNNIHSDNIICSSKWFKKCDYLVIIRGDEVENTKLQEHQDINRWNYLIKKCNKHNVNIIFDYSTRNSSIISATTFIKNLINYKQKNIPKEYLYKYIPSNLSINDKNEILNLLIQYNLH